LNARAERWAKSVKEEALSKLILFGEISLTRVGFSTVASKSRTRPISMAHYYLFKSFAGIFADENVKGVKGQERIFLILRVATTEAAEALGERRPKA